MRGGGAGRPLWILDDGGAVVGGGQLFALRLAATAGRTVTIACPAGSPMDLAARAAGVPVADVPFPAPTPANAAALVQAARRLRRAVPHDVTVVSGAIRASLVAGMARLPVPVVHLLHERDSAQRRSVRAALGRSDRVVVVGGASADAYRHALPGASVTPINNFLAPADLERLVSARRARPDAAAPVIGVLARLIPEKGIDVLVAELAGVPERWTALRVAGARQDEQYAAEVERRIASSGLTDRVELLGHRDDVVAFLAEIDVLVVPSVGNEGQPTVILEALAAGVPVVVRGAAVAADFGGMPVRGYRDAGSLAAALREVPAEPAAPDVLARRFGPEQVLGGLDQAASRGGINGGLRRRRRSQGVM
jgi:glycosyltransferase involved in cell wall biosynthesis